ncbi:MAG: hypothetical protein HQL79_05245 [Magnetococcales bacterium]|nr:hypothetical protein [Magnetococcales bacterium]
MIIRLAKLILLILMVPGLAHAQEPTCRIGFDVGSTGIRVGALDTTHSAKAAIDYLADVWADAIPDATLTDTIQALSNLPREAGLPGACTAIAGGFSAWRYAMASGKPSRVTAILHRIHQKTGVPFFIIPQEVEGRYGYEATQNILKNELTTPWILDIGGGSFEIAGANATWGSDLGSKSWQRLFCSRIRGVQPPDCSVTPLSPADIHTAHTLLDEYLHKGKAIPQAILQSHQPVTAISPPLLKGIYPALRCLEASHLLLQGHVDGHGFDATALHEAIQHLQAKTPTELTQWLDACTRNKDLPPCSPKYSGTLLTNMLLVQAIMDILTIPRVEVAAADINNVTGLLTDDTLRQWSTHYSCYLERLAKQGVDAYLTDPQSCPEVTTGRRVN